MCLVVALLRWLGRPPRSFRKLYRTTVWYIKGWMVELPWQDIRTSSTNVMYAVSLVSTNSCGGTSEFTNNTFRLQGDLRRCTASHSRGWPGEMLNLTKHDHERMVSGITAWGVRRTGFRTSLSHWATTPTNNHPSFFPFYSALSNYWCNCERVWEKGALHAICKQ